MIETVDGTINGRSKRLTRLLLLAVGGAAFVVLTWSVAQQQTRLEQASADAASPTVITITVADSPAHAACEKIDNHSSKVIVIDLRTQSTATPGLVAQPNLVRIPAQGSTQVCVEYTRAALNP